MKKSINYICYGIIMIIGIFDIYYGINYELKQYKFLKNSEKTTADIYQTTNREDGKQVLYIKYYVKNKQYDSVLVLKEKNTSKSSITIYYDKNNPLKLTSGEIDKSGYFIMFLGTFFSLIDILLIIKERI